MYELQTFQHTRYRDRFGWRILKDGELVRLSAKLQPCLTLGEANAEGLAVIRQLQSLRDIERRFLDFHMGGKWNCTRG
jgi:hypothetical protein